MPSSRVSKAYNAAAAASAERRELIDALIACVQNAIQTCEPLPYHPVMHADTLPDRTMMHLPAAAPASCTSEDLGAWNRPQLFERLQNLKQQQQQQQHARLAAEEAGAHLRQGARVAPGVARSHRPTQPRLPAAQRVPSTATRPALPAEDPGPWRSAIEAQMQAIEAGIKSLLERHQDHGAGLSPPMDSPPRRVTLPVEAPAQPRVESDGPSASTARLFYRAPSAAAAGQRAGASAGQRETAPPQSEQRGVQAQAAAQAEASSEEMLRRADRAARELAESFAAQQSRSRWAEKGRRELLTEDLRWAEMAAVERKRAARKAAAERAAAERTAAAQAAAERAAAKEEATRAAEARRAAAEVARHAAHQHVVSRVSGPSSSLLGEMVDLPCAPTTWHSIPQRVRFETMLDKAQQAHLRAFHQP